MLVRGSVDVVTGFEVAGWAYAPGQAEPVLVQVVLNHEILGEAEANIDRPDLAAVGLGDGRCGYLVKLYREINPIYLPFLSVKVAGGDAELPRGGASGFREFFTALHRAHPVSGRTRSVLGGLWTDRIDAAAVLKGKSEVGQLSPACEVPLSRLIDAGFSIVELATPPQQIGDADIAESVIAILEDAALLAVLRGALEDNPLVVSADVVREAETELLQPSAINASPSPVECLVIIAAAQRDVTLDVVRDSHKLPEFSPEGWSRWSGGGAGVAAEMAVRHGVLDRTILPPGSVAVVGPGTIHRLRCDGGGEALQMLCVPNRLMPVSLLTDRTRKETVHTNGVRLFM